MKKITIVIILILQYSFGFSQVQTNMQKAEDSLKVLGKIILNGNTDFIKYNANEKFIALLESALINENSFDYPFDSLVTIARLTSDDKKFRIFNWNIKKSDGTYEYFGFIQAWNKKQKKYIIYPLKDNTEKINNPEYQTLDNLNWYGAHYYKIIFNKSRGKKYYTLLGSDWNNTVTKKKLIDVITFNSKDKPVFGASIFKYNKKVQKRIIFEFSSLTSMTVRFDKQYMLHGKKKKKMIVFDRLAPEDPALMGQYQFYYPETNIFDALFFRFGKWNYIKDIDARNPKETKEDRERRKKVIEEEKEHQRQ